MVHFVFSQVKLARGEYENALKHALIAERSEKFSTAYLNQVGICYMALGNYSLATNHLLKAVQLSPNSAEIQNNLGLVNRHAGKPEKARGHFQRAIEITPEDPTFQMNFALACWESNEPNQAESTLRQLSATYPEHKVFRFNLASILAGQNKTEEAEQILKALKNETPDDPDVLRLEIDMLIQAGEPRKAEEHARRLYALVPKPEYAYPLGELLLSLENYEEGWELYDKRLQMPGFPFRDSAIKRWQGEPLKHKSIYIQNEQGLGDQIMFMSCLQELYAQGSSITLETNIRLASLVERSFPAIKLRTHANESLPAAPKNGFDRITSLGCLPRYLRRSRNDFSRATIPFIKPDLDLVNAWVDKLNTGKKGIGICWRGGLAHTGAEKRSLELLQFLSIFDEQDVQLVSLQRDESPEEKELFKKHSPTLQPFDSRLEDLEQLAACISACSLVVTVCCTIAHLAGAMGKQVIVLTPRGPAWRYGAEGKDMAWYPSVYLARQSSPTWLEAIQETKDQLKSRLALA